MQADLIPPDHSPLEAALIRCASEAKRHPGKAVTREVESDGRSVAVTAKALPVGHELTTSHGARCRLMLRVPFVAGGERDVDRVLMRLEQALDAVLVKRGGAVAPPYAAVDGYRLRHHVTTPDDPWVGHVVTRDGHRCSDWLITHGAFL